MLQMVRGLFAALITLAACSCSHFNLMGLFLPTGDDVDSRFIQSTKINENLCAAAVETDESYIFYVATDPHIDQTHNNLSIFNDALRNDIEAQFGVILGDCIDIRDNLPRYLEALTFDPIRHKCDLQIFHLLGNHDVYFNGWDNFKELIGPSVYWFEVVFSEGKDLYISLDTATGTLGIKQTQWLKSFLENNRRQYRHCTILTHTNCFYTDNSQTGSGNLPIEESFSLIDLLCRHNVSLVLQGHDHYREELIYKDVHFIVLGAISDKSKNPEYLRVEVNPEKVSLDWQIIDN